MPDASITRSARDLRRRQHDHRRTRQHGTQRGERDHHGTLPWVDAEADAPGAGARPAWIVAKGGITAHDVAVHGLGIRRAEVAGQLFPGMISVFRPLDAAPEAVGVPYVVFPGNVGDDETLAEVAAIMHGQAR